MKKVALSLLLFSSLSFAVDISFTKLNIANLANQNMNLESRMNNIQSVDDLERLAIYFYKFEMRLNDFVSRIDLLDNDKLDNNKLDKLLELSNKVTELVTNLDSKMPSILDKFDTHNSDDRYIETLKSLLSTTLRLSDDIGIMADRIGEMADRIGVMADRILYTEDLIVHDSEVISNSSLHISELMSMKIPEPR